MRSHAYVEDRDARNRGNPSTYFIADISANHDGDLERAKALIRMCAEAAQMPPSFRTSARPKIVSERGFARIRDNGSHQAKWKKSVTQDLCRSQPALGVDRHILKKECDAAGIDYLSTPYDFEAVDMLEPFVPALQDRLRRYHMAGNVAQDRVSRTNPCFWRPAHQSMTEVQMPSITFATSTRNSA